MKHSSLLFLFSSFFLVSCGETGVSSSYEEDFSLSLSFIGEGTLSLYQDGNTITEENFSELVEVGDSLTLIATPASRYELTSLTFNEVPLAGKNNQFLFTAVEGINAIEATFSLVAEDVDEFTYEVLEDGTIEITSYLEPAHVPNPVFIPDSIKDKEGEEHMVSSLGPNVFQNSSVKGVRIGKNVSSIDENTFNGAMSLETIEVSEENPYFESDNGILYSLAGELIRMPISSSLKNYSVQEGTIRINNRAFEDCSRLETITLPEGLLSIGNASFYDARSLKSPIFPSTLKSIGEEAFRNADSLASLTLNEGLETLGTGVFYASGVEEVHLSSTLTTLPQWAFYTCDSLHTVVFEEGLKTIGKEAFFRSDIKTLETPLSLETIEDNAFSRCMSLTSVILNEGLLSLGGSAFSASASIPSITIPKSVEHIGMNPFSGLVKLGYQEGSLKVEEGNPYFEVVDNVLYSLGDNPTLISYSYGKVDTTYHIKEGTKTLGRDAFLYVGNVLEIHIPRSVTSIHEAFCSMYTELTTPETLTLIYEGTKAEWLEIDLHGELGEWHSGTNLTNGQVQCVDGPLSVA